MSNLADDERRQLGEKMITSVTVSAMRVAAVQKSSSMLWGPGGAAGRDEAVAQAEAQTGTVFLRP